MTSDVTCRACGSNTEPLWQGRLLDLTVQYFECPKCQYVQTEEPYWLEQAYSSVINRSDTGILARNLSYTRIVIATLWVMKNLDGLVVDYAGGYGILVRLLRDYGIDARWSDPYCENLVARGFEHRDEKAALVTAFEAFEHFVEPEAELQRMLRVAPSVLLSTYLTPTPTPRPETWWYYGREHGQHVGLFREETLRTLARRAGKHLLTDGRVHHLLTDRPINPRRWAQAIRYSGYVPWLIRRQLKSRTWSDHLLMSEASGGDEDRV